MKIRAALATSVALLLLAGTAQAFQWHMTYGQAKHATKEFAKEFCREDAQCTGWGVGPCRRASNSRFDCVMAAFYDGREPGEEIQCNLVLHWGVGAGGYLRLKNYGRNPHCFQV
jgi:hypothetical protein